MKLAAVLLVLGACYESPLPPELGPDALETADAVEPMTITSGDGITVVAVTPVTDRTFDILVSTPLVDDAATSHGNGVRVTLPPDYATSGKRYPVVYDLHGAGGGSYRDQWAGGVVEAVAAADVIVVMPDGGKNGWYTDWLDQGIAQNWKTYHLTQLVPFIDRNLRTLGTRTGRGIVGLSMGGFGASRYAADRPDLFGALAAFSGAIDLEQPTIQTAVIAPSILFGLPAFGAYGGYVLSPVWAAANPVRRAENLATVATFIYIGAGTDPAELIVRAATESMHRALVAKGVAHTYVDYGVPGAFAYGTCNGGHTFDCYKYALADAMPRVLAALAPAQAPGRSTTAR